MARLVLAAALMLVPPVEGPAVRPFDPPDAPWAAGHRGVDYRVPPGTPVRAAAPGVVAFAGRVAGGLHVAVDHLGGVRTSYAYLSRLGVGEGVRVERGTVLGWSGGTGPGHGPDLVHFGVRERGRYVEPAPARVRLAPLDGGPAPPCGPESGPARAATLAPPGLTGHGIHTPAFHR